jgi:Family of unknown function (DUF5715)
MNILRRSLIFLVVAALLAASVWSFRRYRLLRHLQPITTSIPQTDLWAQGVEKIKADRGEPMGPNAPVEIPAELRHYSDRHWFLATQVAEVRKANVPSSQDFLDLGSMIQRGEMVTLPAATADYVLFGVGAEADEGPFTRYQDGKNIELYNESALGKAYAELESSRSRLQTQISALKTQLASLKKNERTKQTEIRKEMTARERELGSNKESKAQLDESYGRAESKARLVREYESLQVLARNLGGRSYNLDDPKDRRAMKVSMLSSLRPAAVKILEEVATSYHSQFERPLPVSSLVRPEQYQHALRRVNRNAVLIETPPHSTGLAFDIDYRYMTAAEQTFIMNELARLENEGRIEVIRERNANYHIFAFLNGRRPTDELITASLEEAGGQLPGKEVETPSKAAHHATKPAAKPAAGKRGGKRATVKEKSRARGRRRH